MKTTKITAPTPKTTRSRNKVPPDVEWAYFCVNAARYLKARAAEAGKTMEAFTLDAIRDDNDDRETQLLMLNVLTVAACMDDQAVGGPLRYAQGTLSAHQAPSKVAR